MDCFPATPGPGREIVMNTAVVEERVGPSSTDREGAWHPSQRSIVVVLSVALVARVSIACFLYPYIQQRTGLATASDGYEHIATTFAAGEGYRFAADLGETMFIMPVYPLFLAGLFLITGPSLVAGQIANSILDTLTCYLIYRVGRRGFGDRAGFLGALVYALYPGAWIACSRFLTEPLFVFLTMAFIAVFARFLSCGRWRYALLASLCCMLSVLCKSVAGLLPIFLIGGVLVLPFWKGCRKRTIMGLSLCLSVVFLGVGAWVYRSYRLTDHFVFPSTSGGLALYAAHVYAAHPEQSIHDSVHQAAAEVRALGERNGIKCDPRDAYPRWFYSPKDELKLDHLARQAAQEHIAADPASFARHVVGNLWRFWWGAPTRTSMIVAALLNIPLVLLAAVGLLMSRWWKQPTMSLWILMAAYFFLTHVAVLSVVRYSLTVMPLVCLLAGTPLAFVLKKLHMVDLVEA